MNIFLRHSIRFAVEDKPSTLLGRDKRDRFAQVRVSCYSGCALFFDLFTQIGYRHSRLASGRLGIYPTSAYLVAFPVQQTVIGLFGPHIYATKVSLTATPTVLDIAYFSWQFIEKPCLVLKRGGALAPKVGAGQKPRRTPMRGLLNLRECSDTSFHDYSKLTDHDTAPLIRKINDLFRLVSEKFLRRARWPSIIT